MIYENFIENLSIVINFHQWRCSILQNSNSLASLTLLSIFTLYSAIVVDSENSSIHIDAVIDPLSPSGQKLSSILRVLSKYIQPSMRIVLNPLVRCSKPRTLTSQGCQSCLFCQIQMIVFLNH